METLVQIDAKLSYKHALKGCKPYMAAAAMIRVKPFASRWNFLNFLDFLRSKAGFLLRILLFYTVKPAGLYLTSTSAPCFSIPRSLYLT